MKRYAFFDQVPDKNYPDQIPPRGKVVLVDDRTRGCSSTAWYETETVAAARQAARRYQANRIARNRRIDQIKGL